MKVGEVGVGSSNAQNGLFTVGERQKKKTEKKRERESIREESWSIMVSHSTTAGKGKGREAV